MEKMIYLLWPEEPEGTPLLFERLRQEAVTTLQTHASRVAFHFDDDSVAPGEALRIGAPEDLPRAFVTCWADSAQHRRPIEEAFYSLTSRVAGYLVTESAPLAPRESTSGRTAGFCQIAMLKKPDHLSREAWLQVWLDSHTQVAIETQSTFAYRQNIVTRVLTPNAPPWDAIVEESFPIEALSDPYAFYATDGDAAKLSANTQRMMESCARFIDFDAIAVLPTSEFKL